MKYCMAIVFVVVMYGTAVGENLIMYHKDAAHEHYYDKNSIMYPNRNSFGNRPDKSIVEVWEIRKSLSTKNIKRTEKRINCNTRRIDVKNIIENGVPSYDRDLYKSNIIQSNTADSSLFNELCIRSRYR